MILSSFAAAVRQIGDPRFRRILWLGLFLALALLFAVYAAFLLAIQAFVPEAVDLPLVGPVTGLQQLFGWGSLVLMAVLSVFLMVPVAALFCGLFLDEVAAAVEARHYPHLPPSPPRPRGETLIESVNLMGLIVGLNLFGLFLLPFIGPAYLLVFWAVNGGLLAREYFMLAALRHLPRAEAATLRGRHRLRLWLAGLLMAAPLSVPLVNLLLPLLGAATFTHLFHRLRARG